MADTEPAVALPAETPNAPAQTDAPTPAEAGNTGDAPAPSADTTEQPVPGAQFLSDHPQS
jgi:hypothetical protein